MFGQGLPFLPSSQSVHSIKKRQIAQEASPSGRFGQNARRCAIANIQKRHPYQAASHGTFVCPCDAIRFQAGALAKTLASSYSGISYIRHTKHHDTSVLWERAGYGDTLIKEAILQLTFIVFDYPQRILQVLQRTFMLRASVSQFCIGKVVKK
jgi:hypothetical protein